MSDDLEHDDPTEPDGIRNLREAHRRANEEAEKLRQQNRDLVFKAAGVDVESTAGKYLYDTYRGDLDVDALGALAKDLGAVKAGETVVVEGTPEATEDGEDTDPGLVEQTRQRRALTAEGIPVDVVPSVDVIDSAYAAFKDDLSSGASQEDAQTMFIHRMFADAYNKPDSRLRVQ